MTTGERFAGFLFVASVVAWGLTGCGGPDISCAEGTTQEGEKCVPNVVCGDGTMPNDDGECIVGESGCKAGTTWDTESKSCVVAGDEVCAEGTTYNEMANACEPEITGCGENTELSDSGECVPTLDALCGSSGAVKVVDGTCKIADAACATGTQLSANGNCVASDEACGQGLALNDEGTCEATDEVCGEKTTFNEDMGLCTPDETCQMGDVVADGVCVSPAEKLAKNADLAESENNDPSNGGSANELTVENVGESTVFTGTIEAPRTLDGSSEELQDVDSFSFTGSAGDWFKISVQSTGLPQPMLMVTGPNDYARWSPSGRRALTETDMRPDDAGRKLVLPWDGDYTIHVMPTAQVLDPSLGPAGDSDWTYVGALEKVDPAMPATHDLSMNPLTGDAGLPDNTFYDVSGFSSGQLIELSFDSAGADVDASLQIWKDATTMSTSIDVDGGTTTVLPLPELDNDKFFGLLDWSTMTGSKVGYEISASAITDSEDLGDISTGGSSSGSTRDLSEDGSYYYTFRANAGEVIEIEHTNEEGEEIEYVLRDSSGTQLSSNDDLETIDNITSAAEGYYYTAQGGSLALEVTATADLTNHQLTVHSMTPGDVGTGKIGDTLSLTRARMGGTPEDRSDFATVTFTERVWLSGTLTPTKPNGDEDVDFYLYDADYSEVIEETGLGGEVEIPPTTLDSGTYVVRVEGDEAFNEFDLELTLETPPDPEVEPNDTVGQAQTVTLGKSVTGESNSNNTDVYEISLMNNLAADEVLLIDAPGSYEYNDWSCELVDGSGNTLQSQTDKDDGCAMVTGGLSAGSYYFKITSADSSASDYLLTVSKETGTIESETNDSPGMANSVTYMDWIMGTPIYGTAEGSDTDHFSVTLSNDLGANEALVASIEHLGPDPATLEIELLDSMDNNVAGGDASTVAAVGLGAGTYTLLIDDASTGADGQYRIDGRLFSPDVSVSAMPGSTIVHDEPMPVTSNVTASGCGTVQQVTVDTDISMNRGGHLQIDLVGPGGTSVTLQDSGYSSSSTAAPTGNFPFDIEPDGDLSAFNGQSGNGQWTLEVSDPYSFSSHSDGTFNSWTLNLDCQ